VTPVFFGGTFHSVNIYGRPKKILGQSIEARQFLQLYLDPLISKKFIIQQCKISQATFYNYERELDLPQIRVGIGCPQIDLPLGRVFSKINAADDLYELNLLRKISPLIQTRFKLIPTLRANVYAAPYALKKREIDLAISSISKTEEKNRDFYFSDSYFEGRSPHGVLMRKKTSYTPTVSEDRPLLGVVSSSVHSEYAAKHLQKEFHVRSFRTASIAFQALNAGRVDFVLFHPSWFQILPQDTAEIEICSKPYRYKSHTGILFHPDSEFLRPGVNRAIEIIHEQHAKSRPSF